MSALTNAQSGLTFGQLWQGEVAYARKELSHTPGKGKLKLSMVTEKDGDEEDDAEKCLAVPVVHVHGQALHALLDSGATSNILSSKAVKMLALNPERTSRVVTVASEAKSGAMGKLTEVLLMFEEVQVNLDLIILENVSFNVVIGRPTLKSPEGVLNFQQRLYVFITRTKPTYFK